MAWTKVYYDTKRQDQSETRLGDDGSVQQNCIQTWMAVNDVQTTSAVEAETASADGSTIPTVGQLYTLGGQANWKCVRRLPKRTSESPLAFEVQVEYERKTHAPQGGRREVERRHLLQRFAIYAGCVAGPERRPAH